MLYEFFFRVRFESSAYIDALYPITISNLLSVIEFWFHNNDSNNSNALIQFSNILSNKINAPVRDLIKKHVIQPNNNNIAFQFFELCN